MLFALGLHGAISGTCARRRLHPRHPPGYEASTPCLTPQRLRLAGTSATTNASPFLELLRDPRTSPCAISRQNWIELTASCPNSSASSPNHRSRYHHARTMPPESLLLWFHVVSIKKGGLASGTPYSTRQPPSWPPAAAQSPPCTSLWDSHSATPARTWWPPARGCRPPLTATQPGTQADQPTATHSCPTCVTLTH